MSHGGAIVNVTSGAAGRPTWGAYSISKLALDGITGMLREELADRAHPVRGRQPRARPHRDARGGLPGRGSRHRSPPVQPSWSRSSPSRPEPTRARTSRPRSGRGPDRRAGADPAPRAHERLARRADRAGGRGPGGGGRHRPAGPRRPAVPRHGAARGRCPRAGCARGWPHRLAAVASGLPDGRSLVVWDGYRTIETQAALYHALPGGAGDGPRRLARRGARGGRLAVRHPALAHALGAAAAPHRRARSTSPWATATAGRSTSAPTSTPSSPRPPRGPWRERRGRRATCGARSSGP